jgi:hypothetical protein
LRCDRKDRSAWTSHGAVRTGESEILEGRGLGRVHRLLDVDTGRVLARLVLAAGEVVGAWMTSL